MVSGRVGGSSSIAIYHPEWLLMGRIFALIINGLFDESVRK
jgi:hypothetical protein